MRFRRANRSGRTLKIGNGRLLRGPKDQVLKIVIGGEKALAGVIFESAHSFPDPQVRMALHRRRGRVTEAPSIWGW